MSQKTKKIFISYSWKPIQNKITVIDLAERLSNDGIHVILDDWDLKEGQDKYHFMEQMVNDESVDKVLLICNKEYSTKANTKIGGVGIESLIISDSIYSQVEQTKFIPVVMEFENGNPCLPTFVKTRIFIDLSDKSLFEENYDKLIRNIYNKPLTKRPPIGKMPVHLEDESPLFLPTAHKVAQIKSALVNGNLNTGLFIKDYLKTFIESLLLFKLEINNIDNNNFIHEVELSIDKMQPLKNDFIEFLNIITQYSAADYNELLLDFFENILQFYEDNDINLAAGNGLNSLIHDNFRFFNYDLFLSFVSTLMKNEKYETLGYIYKNSFFVSKKYNGKSEVLNFVEFRGYNYTLNEFKNQLYNPKRVSIVADNIKKYSTLVDFENNKKSDVLSYYMSLFYPQQSAFREQWFPETSCYSSYHFELFPKIISKRYFEKIKIIFDVDSVEEFKSKVLKIAETDTIQRGYYKFPFIKHGLNIENVATLT